MRKTLSLATAALVLAPIVSHSQKNQRKSPIKEEAFVLAGDSIIKDLDVLGRKDASLLVEMHYQENGKDVTKTLTPLSRPADFSMVNILDEVKVNYPEGKQIEVIGFRAPVPNVVKSGEASTPVFLGNPRVIAVEFNCTSADINSCKQPRMAWGVWSKRTAKYVWSFAHPQRL